MDLGKQFAESFQLRVSQLVLLGRFSRCPIKERNLKVTNVYPHLTMASWNRMRDIHNTRFGEEIVGKPECRVRHCIIQVNLEEEALVVRAVNYVPFASVPVCAKVQ